MGHTHSQAVIVQTLQVGHLIGQNPYIFSQQRQNSARGTQRGTVLVTQGQVVFSVGDLPTTLSYFVSSTQTVVFAYCRFDCFFLNRSQKTREDKLFHWVK